MRSTGVLVPRGSLGLPLALCGALLSGCGAAQTAPPLSARAARHGSGDATHAVAIGPCSSEGVWVQVLGSGGPIMDDARASAGYLVWVDGRARLVVDMGAGTAVRFAQSQADVSDLDALLITHFHVDHASDVEALLKSASFSQRGEPLVLVGPSGGGPFPPLSKWLSNMVSDGGAYAYLSGYLAGGQPFRIEPRQLEVDQASDEPVFENERFTVRAVSVPHGPVPTLAYDVSVKDLRVAFMADQRADQQPYLDMIQDADLLMAHMAIGQQAGAQARNLHATPTQIGQSAAQAGVKHVVLGHLMQRALADLDGNVEAVKSAYEGNVTVARDGLCVRAGASE